METKNKEVTIVDLTRPGVMATYVYYKDGLHYNVEIANGDMYRVVLPAADFDRVTLNMTEKASMFRKWITKAMKSGDLMKIS